MQSTQEYYLPPLFTPPRKRSNSYDFNVSSFSSPGSVYPIATSPDHFSPSRNTNVSLIGNNTFVENPSNPPFSWNAMSSSNHIRFAGYDYQYAAYDYNNIWSPSHQNYHPFNIMASIPEDDIGCNGMISDKEEVDEEDIEVDNNLNPLGPGQIIL